MIDVLLHALVASKNEAADDVLLEALRLGDERERRLALLGLIRRQTVRGLGGVIEYYDSLPESIQRDVLQRIRIFHHALRECGRSDRTDVRLAAMKLIALGRQGKLAYVLSENLHEADEILSRAATEAMVALARWVATETRSLQKGSVESASDGSSEGSGSGLQGLVEDKEAPPSSLNPEPRTHPDHTARCKELMDQRPEIEAAVARAMDVHRGRHGQELLRAALLLADWVGSKTLAILQTTKHGGQSSMVRRLQQAPASEHVEAFLLAASHAQLRSHFGVIFAHIDEAPVLDALLRKTYWLKDHQLQLCMHQVARGTWWGASELRHDLERRPPEDAARIGDWLAVSGAADNTRDERMDDLLRHGRDNLDARLRLLRIGMQRKHGASCRPLISMLGDSDERIVRMAARELVRRKPKDYENSLLQLMTHSSSSVRRVISRAIGQTGFEQFWQRFDKLERTMRKQAGRAMLKLLPDAVLRLQRRLISGPVEQRIKAMQIAQELDLAEPLRDTLLHLCADPHPRLRSKAVMALGRIGRVPAETLIDRLMNDSDARVRANAIEVLGSKVNESLIPVLVQRARAANNRERGNAIKALHALNVGGMNEQLLGMLRDARAEHRASALWVLKKTGLWQLLSEVGKLAKADNDQRVRRSALSVLRGVADMARAQKAKAG